jgi:hypothetical protein
MSFYRNRLALGAIPQERHVDRRPGTAILLHFNGDNGSSTFLDVSGRTWTTSVDPPILSTTLPKLGTASGLFSNAASEYIVTATSDDFVLGTGNFTFDCWVKWSTTTLGFIFANSCIWIHKNGGNIGVWRWDTAGNYLNYYCGSDISQNVWHHIAVVRNGTSLKIYIDGVATGAGVTLDAGYSFYATPGNSYIGAFPAQSQYLNGYIDEFRFIKGEALWTADFTPPTVEYQ